MNIQQDLRLREKYTQGFARTKPVKYITVHGTGGGSSAARLLKWMLKPGKQREDWYKRGIALFHYIIDRDGSIIELIDPDKWVYHASVGKWDAGSIGIELMNPKSDNSGDYTSMQYRALTFLCKELIYKYPIEKIYSHKYAKEVIAKRGSKNCPGNFNWKKFSKELYNKESFQELNKESNFKVKHERNDCLIVTH